MLTFIAVVPPWIVVLTVFAVIHVHLSKAIVRAKDATRRQIRRILDRLYAALEGATRDEVLRFKELLALDREIFDSDRLAINVFPVWQAVSSLLVGSGTSVTKQSGDMGDKLTP
jgi:hypothetical protein